MPTPARFTIRAASALTGINPNTLRAWERRYGLVTPERTPKGYRLYSQEDVQRLRQVQSALQQGISVGRVRAYLDESSAPGTEFEASPPPVPASRPRTIEVSLASAGLIGTTTIRLPVGRRERTVEASLAEFAEQIEQAVLRFDRPAVERAFCTRCGRRSTRRWPPRSSASVSATSGTSGTSPRSIS
jgi:DNA-binding transcriptional MerR regulator